MLNQPTSSPMIMRMLGFLVCALAVTAINAAHAVAAQWRSFLYLIWQFVCCCDCLDREFAGRSVLELPAWFTIELLASGFRVPDLRHDLFQVPALRVLKGREFLVA